MKKYNRNDHKIIIVEVKERMKKESTWKQNNKYVVRVELHLINVNYLTSQITLHKSLVCMNINKRTCLYRCPLVYPIFVYTMSESFHRVLVIS